MVDLETTGKTARAGILQIGAVEFCPVEGKLGREFKERVKPQQNREVDVDTVMWWMTQKEEARLSAWSPRAGPWGLSTSDLMDTLIDLRIWMQNVFGERRVEGVWAHGILFDVAILEDAFRQTKLSVPWHYRAPRDTRTLFALACPEVDAAKVIDELAGPVQEGEVIHDALHDARRQARAVCAAYKRLGLSRAVSVG
jgi:hypothetical protein